MFHLLRRPGLVFHSASRVATRQESCWFFRWSRRSQELCSHETSTNLSSLDSKNIKFIQNSWDTTPSSKILAAKIDVHLLMQLIFYDVVWPYLQQLWCQRVLISWPNKQTWTFTPCWPDGYGWLSIQFLHTSGQVMVQWIPKAGWSEGKLLRFSGIGQRTLMDLLVHKANVPPAWGIHHILNYTGYVCPGSGFPVLLVFQHVQPIWGYHSSVLINWYIHTWWILVAWLVLRAQIYAHFEELESKQSWPVCNVAVKLLRWPFPKPIGITCPLPSTRWFKCTTSWIAAFFEVWHYGNTVCFKSPKPWKSIQKLKHKTTISTLRASI